MLFTAMAKPAYNHRHRQLRKALGIGAGARCYWCGGFATDLDHVMPLAEGGANGPKVPSCRRCNNRRAKEVQARMAKRRAAGALDRANPGPPPPPKDLVPLPWSKLGERRPRRKVYPGAIRSN